MNAPATPTNGAAVLVRTAVAEGIRVCFANPGTTELPILRAMEDERAIRPILTLFEGVATGAADGYGRMATSPAFTLMHLGPGLANGLANLHNARRARSPIVNLVGDHPTWHRGSDSPLASDIEAIAGSVSGFVRTVRSANAIATDLVDAVAATRRPPGRVATLVVPADCQWDAPSTAAPPAQKPAPAGISVPRVTAAADALKRGGGALLLGGSALQERGLRAAQRIGDTGVRLLMETFPARLDHRPGMPVLERLAYVPAMARGQLARFRSLVLAGADSPVAYFAERDAPSSLLPAGIVPQGLAVEGEDLSAALEALADALGAPNAPRVAAPTPERVSVPQPSLPLNAATIVSAIAALQPEGIVFVDEGVGAGGAYLRTSGGAPAHSYLALTGGATGMGLPCAVGAAVACPDRKVVAFVGDGSAMYTVQALWTMARESLDVVTVICSNGAYRILQLEIERKSGSVGPVALGLTDLRRPPIDWVSLSGSLGVPAVKVVSTETLVLELRRSFAERGPRLLEVVA